MGFIFGLSFILTHESYKAAELGWAMGGILGIYYGINLLAVSIWQGLIRVKEISIEECLLCIKDSDIKEKKIYEGAVNKIITLSHKSSDAFDILIDVATLAQVGNDLKVKALIAIRNGSYKKIGHALKILPLLKNEDMELRKEASDTLIMITGKNFGEDVEQWTSWIQEAKIKSTYP